MGDFPQLPLDLEETQALGEILALLSHRAKHPVSLKQLLRQWADFVTEVERGYADSIYEYTNDLTTRDALEELRLTVPESLRDKLSEFLGPLDERFNRATHNVQRPLVRSLTNEELGAWWFRIPKELRGELKADLQSEGVWNG